MMKIKLFLQIITIHKIKPFLKIILHLGNKELKALFQRRILIEIFNLNLIRINIRLKKIIILICF